MTTQSRSTNSVQGDVQSASVATFMAINGNGFFAVQKPGNFTDGTPVFDGVDRYTRRGDFQLDKSGYLVNGAGYYLQGVPIDPTTGNPSRQFAAGPADSRTTSCRRRKPPASTIAPTSPAIR